MRRIINNGFLPCLIALLFSVSVAAQDDAAKSIGGKEHDNNILGVKIGMDVPTALETIFTNSGRKAGQEKPDGKRNEGKDKKDVRVLYKGLKAGDVQILFADGKWVKEIILEYASKPNFENLRLADSGSVYDGIGGQRYDDRYTIKFTDDVPGRRRQIWLRDQPTTAGFRERIQFISEKETGKSSVFNYIVSKVIVVTPEDEAKFLTAMSKQ